jgi:hypothetical protein
MEYHRTAFREGHIEERLHFCIVRQKIICLGSAAQGILNPAMAQGNVKIGSCTLSGVEGMNVEKVIRNSGNLLIVVFLEGLRN